MTAAWCIKWSHEHRRTFPKGLGEQSMLQKYNFIQLHYSLAVVEESFRCLCEEPCTEALHVRSLHPLILDIDCFSLRPHPCLCAAHEETARTAQAAFPSSALTTAARNTEQLVSETQPFCRPVASTCPQQRSGQVWLNQAAELRGAE